MQHLTLMSDSSLLHQLIIITYQITSPQLQNYGLPLHLPHLYTAPLPSYSHLLDYTPSSIYQPQPTDAILVPRECMWDARLRCPPVVELTRDPVVENLIRALQDHLPPSMEDQDQDVIYINTPPEYIEETSDSDVVCLD